jgi:adenylylsulfate kinase
MPHRGWTIWLTGPPAAGKTTLAYALWEQLGQLGVVTAVLDSDELRRVLTPDATYSEGDRDAFYHRLIGLAQLLSSEGVNIVIAATANKSDYRAHARRVLGPFAEVWVRCPLEVCRARDPKGLYAAQAAGMLTDLPGVDGIYEPPTDPAVVIDTDKQSVADGVESIMASVPFLRAEVWAAART